jgi:hypothetical protein
MCPASSFTCATGMAPTAWPWTKKGTSCRIRGCCGRRRNWRDCTFEVTDEAGQLVLTVPFSQVSLGP